MNGQLARLARATAGGAGRARLAIHGCPSGPDSPVAGLYTDDGWPVFWCGLGSPVAVAAAENRTAVLTVRGPADTPGTVTVLLAGSLKLIGQGRAHGRQVGAVSLALEQVLVKTCAPGRPAVTRPVPVSEYASADPEALADRAEQLAGQISAAHGEEPRRFVAEQSGIPASRVAAAWLAGLDKGGARLERAGHDGTQTMPASFPRQARTVAELALLLREQLSAGRARAERGQEAGQ